MSFFPPKGLLLGHLLGNVINDVRRRGLCAKGRESEREGEGEGEGEGESESCLQPQC